MGHDHSEIEALADTAPELDARVRAYARSLHTGDLVRLRPALPTDFEPLTGWLTDPAHRIAHPGGPTGHTPVAVTSWLRDLHHGINRSRLAFCITTLDGALVGHAVLTETLPTARVATLDVMIGAPYVDEGYRADATALMLHLAFAEHGLNKVETSCWEYGHRDIAALTALGFAHEGTRRCAVFHDGGYTAILHWGLTAAEYHERRAANRVALPHQTPTTAPATAPGALADDALPRTADATGGETVSVDLTEPPRDKQDTAERRITVFNATEMKTSPRDATKLSCDEQPITEIDVRDLADHDRKNSDCTGRDDQPAANGGQTGGRSAPGDAANTPESGQPGANVHDRPTRHETNRVTTPAPAASVPNTHVVGAPLTTAWHTAGFAAAVHTGPIPIPDRAPDTAPTASRAADEALPDPAEPQPVSPTMPDSGPSTEEPNADSSHDVLESPDAAAPTADQSTDADQPHDESEHTEQEDAPTSLGEQKDTDLADAAEQVADNQGHAPQGTTEQPGPHRTDTEPALAKQATTEQKRRDGSDTKLGKTERGDAAQSTIEQPDAGQSSTEHADAAHVSTTTLPITDQASAPATSGLAVTEPAPGPTPTEARHGDSGTGPARPRYSDVGHTQAMPVAALLPNRGSGQERTNRIPAGPEHTPQEPTGHTHTGAIPVTATPDRAEATTDSAANTSPDLANQAAAPTSERTSRRPQADSIGDEQHGTSEQRERGGLTPGLVARQSTTPSEGPAPQFGPVVTTEPVEDAPAESPLELQRRVSELNEQRAALIMAGPGKSRRADHLKAVQAVSEALAEARHELRELTAAHDVAPQQPSGRRPQSRTGSGRLSAAVDVRATAKNTDMADNSTVKRGAATAPRHDDAASVEDAEAAPAGGLLSETGLLFQQRSPIKRSPGSHD